MKLLALDTSGPVAGVALMEDGRITHEISAAHGLTHSQVAMPMVEEALSAAGLAPNEIDCFVAVTGPGSFTGVRIGVCAVKAMAHAAGKPVIAIDALEALAAGIYSFDGIVCPVLDARRAQVYCAAFRVTRGVTVRVTEDRALSVQAFVESLPTEENLLFLGDGMPVNRTQIESLAGARAAFAPAHLCFLRAAAACHLASTRGDEAMNYLALNPLYLRAPQAERERAEKLRAAEGTAETHE